jgi:hypothetical protein
MSHEKFCRRRECAACARVQHCWNAQGQCCEQARVCVEACFGLVESGSLISCFDVLLVGAQGWLAMSRSLSDMCDCCLARILGTRCVPAAALQCQAAALVCLHWVATGVSTAAWQHRRVQTFVTYLLGFLQRAMLTAVRLGLPLLFLQWMQHACMCLHCVEECILIRYRASTQHKLYNLLPALGHTSCTGQHPVLHFLGSSFLLLLVCMAEWVHACPWHCCSSTECSSAECTTALGATACTRRGVPLQ